MRREQAAPMIEYLLAAGETILTAKQWEFVNNVRGKKWLTRPQGEWLMALAERVQIAKANPSEASNVIYLISHDRPRQAGAAR
jgi:hypothetical protein